jgi:hypothetical protein
VLCSTLSSTVVYATGSSAVTLFLGQIAQALQNSTTPFVVVYKSSASCAGVSAMLDPANNHMTGNATYWNPDPTISPTSAQFQLTCALDPAGVNADVGFSDVFPATCQDLPMGLDIVGLHDFRGPNQVMNFVVPQNSSEHAISAEAAYLVYGFDAMSPFVVGPWTDPHGILQRTSTSGTQAMIAATIGLPRDRWIGVPNSGSSGLRDALLVRGMMGTMVANQSIGILASDVADPYRDRLRILAYRDLGQNCAFTPDSSESSKDKRNVRDGHYPIFGPLHMIARANAGAATNGNVQRLINVIDGVETLHDTSGTPLDIIVTYAQRGLVPQCAMHVTRNSDGGEITPATPTQSCDCYFEEGATMLSPPNGCTPCMTSSQCPSSAPNCVRFGAQSVGGHSGYCAP